MGGWVGYLDGGGVGAAGKLGEESFSGRGEGRIIEGREEGKPSFVEEEGGVFGFAEDATVWKRWVGGWVGGWIGKIEEEEGV